MSVSCFYVISDIDSLDVAQACVSDSLIINITAQSETVTNDLLNSNIGVASDMDQVWVLFCGFLVFFMQLGFTMLEAGVVKAPNVQHILFKNLMDTCFASVSWWLFGYCVAFGVNDENSFIGTENVALSKIAASEWHLWYFQFAFATTAATIVSGCIAERCTMIAYAIYTVVSIVWIYPVVVHWIWDSDGFLSAFNDNAILAGGVIDFAGCGVVHMVGGFSGLVGAIFLGPRLGRFDHNSRYKNFLGNNVSLQVLGLFVLWLGWYGFNCGSTLVANNTMELASKIAVNTTFGATAGGVTCALVAANLDGFWSIPRIVNGVLVGLVSITSSCAVIEPGMAMVTGMIGALVYFFVSRFLVRLEIDDPLDAFAVHGAGGVWGMLAVGLFATKKDIYAAGYNETIAEESHGDRFGHQLIAVLFIIGWVCLNAIPMFGALKYFRLLRVSSVEEESGLDWVEHGGTAVAGYEEDAENSRYSNTDGLRSASQLGKSSEDENANMTDGDGQGSNVTGTGAPGLHSSVNSNSVQYQ